MIHPSTVTINDGKPLQVKRGAKRASLSYQRDGDGIRTRVGGLTPLACNASVFVRSTTPSRDARKGDGVPGRSRTGAS